jgi:serine/threonine protein kinase
MKHPTKMSIVKEHNIGQYNTIFIWEKLIGVNQVTLFKGIQFKTLEKFILENDYFNHRSNEVKFMSDLVNIIEIFHQNKFIHTELNLKSILVRTDLNKPIFFEFDYLVKEGEITFQYNKKNYLAPELLELKKLDKPFLNNYSHDVYALGVIFYAIITRQLPYELKHSEESELLKKDIIFSNNSFYEDEVNIIQNAMVIEKFRMSLTTFHHQLFVFRICQVKHHIQNTIIFHVGDEPRLILEKGLKDNLDILSSEIDVVEEEDDSYFKTDLVNLVIWLVLIFIIFGIFFVFIKLYCFSK